MLQVERYERLVFDDLHSGSNLYRDLSTGSVNQLLDHWLEDFHHDCDVRYREVLESGQRESLPRLW